VSANPTGPLTIAHARQAAVGDSLSRIIEFCGGRAHREYYLNDRGVQMEILGRSVARRYRELEDGPAVGGDDSFPEEYYRGEYIRELAKLLHDAHKSELETLSDSVREERIRDLSADRLLEGIRRDLEDFRVAFDRFFSECSLDRDNSIESCLDDLEHKELTYIREGALWFRSTKFGDDKDRVLVKSDGSQTYLTADIAYHRNKLERGFERLIDILGPDHHGYIPRLKAAVASLGHDPEKLRVLIVQLTTLYRGSVQLRMSTRRGEFITLRQLIDEVGVDAARYFFASRKTDTHLDFDLELAKRQTPDNPVFYVQYAFARISSILRKARERGIEADPDRHPFRVDAINDPEKNLLKRLSRFPETVLDAARHLEPQRITSYLEETAGVFQKYYSQGNRVITGDVPGTLQRMIVCRCFQQTIHNALTLLGINAPERM
jgi:arginyl-tRNA synthetase